VLGTGIKTRGLGAEPPTSWRPSGAGMVERSDVRAEGTGRKLVPKIDDARV
jgi:hypothetical protein